MITLQQSLSCAQKLKRKILGHVPPLFFSLSISHLGTEAEPVIWISPSLPSEVPYTISSPESPKKNIQQIQNNKNRHI